MVGLAENIVTQPSLAGAWAELGNTDHNIEAIVMQSNSVGNNTKICRDRNRLFEMLGKRHD